MSENGRRHKRKQNFAKKRYNKMEFKRESCCSKCPHCNNQPTQVNLNIHTSSAVQFNMTGSSGLLNT